MNKFYITTAIDYVNDTIHIGHAFQKVIADVLARYYRIKLGEENVFFLTGTDEYGQKAEKAAKEAGASTREFADKISASDQKEQDSLNISYNRFIRTTDPDHQKAVQEIWRRIDKAGDIYLGEYTGIYCEGCEAYYSEGDLIDGKCPFHPTLQIKQVTEKNYFFKWSKYRDFLIEHLKSHPNFVIPEPRRNEMLAFAKNIRDIPISRANLKWGIPVPDDPEQVIYVWFDGLTSYLTGVGFLEDEQKFEKFWPADVHILGKDNVRWHALLWPAMLKSAGIDGSTPLTINPARPELRRRKQRRRIELPKTILVNGFLSLNGQKISKSLGNIIRPSDWVSKFGADAVRYYLIRYANLTEDSDISEEKLKIAYNADLANGIGNLAERVFTMILNGDIDTKERYIDRNFRVITEKIESDYNKQFEEYNLSGALGVIFSFVKQLDRDINEQKPWAEDVLSLAEKGLFLNNLFFGIERITAWLTPFMPKKTREAGIFMEKIRNRKIAKGERLNLFPRM